MVGINTLADDFFANNLVAVEPKFLKEGDKVFLLDPEIVDPETEFYAIVPAKVLLVDPRPSRIPNRMYYWFVADGSKDDSLLNVKQEKFNGQDLVFYKYLENTSPYIFMEMPTPSNNK